MTLTIAYILRLEQYLKPMGIQAAEFFAKHIDKAVYKTVTLSPSASPSLQLLFLTARALGVTPEEFLNCDFFRSSDLILE